VARACVLCTQAGRKLAITRILAGEYDAAAVRAQIASLAGQGVVVFSQTSCPFCKKAKALLDSVGAKYDVVELDTLGARPPMCVSLSVYVFD
jgi:thiol-disulfide isomerase/thioredoxin